MIRKEPSLIDVLMFKGRGRGSLSSTDRIMVGRAQPTLSVDQAKAALRSVHSALIDQLPPVEIEEIADFPDQTVLPSWITKRKKRH